MAARALSWLARPALLRALMSQVRLAARLVREPRVPLAVKALLTLPALYLVSPVDVLPDIIPGLGQLDDLGVLLLALQAFVRLCPPAAVDFHRSALGQGRAYGPMAPSDVVIDAEFRRG
jgi:uncharacterized membrane protein YkvA (DUF1232 family)